MISELRRALLAYHRRHRRDLPWRRRRDPYAVWISEVMLQQTQAATVATRFDSFLDEFPTVADLAAADVERVCEAWSGLGYYRRARGLHAAARCLVDEHGGVLPASPRELERLPGIGRYTAGAIASIAYGVEAACVDGNVARVLARVFAVGSAPESAGGRRRLWELATALVAGSRPGDVNEALMDLGATVCTPSAPRCDACPIARWCRARTAGRQSYYPRPRPRPERRRLAVAFAWLASPRGVWLERRSVDGAWAGQWQLPGEEGQRAKTRLAERLGVDLGGSIVRVRHQLTHRSVHAVVYEGSRSPRWRERADRRRTDDPLASPLSALARKAIVATLARRR